ncbi:MAG: twin-arginine translocase subunit TatC [Chloroflexota bacterium]
MKTDPSVDGDIPIPSVGQAVPPDDPPPGSGVMTLVEHLTELRNRIIKSVLAVAIGSVAGFYFNRQIRDFLLLPLPGHQVQVLNPGDAFSITLRIGIISGVILAMPVILYQVWGFVAPGLTPQERRAFRLWIPVSLVFFGIGVLLAWFVLPIAVSFLLSFTDESLRANLAAGPYFDFVGTLFLGFGVAMQYPVVLYGLARVGIVSSAQLRAWRRYVILIVFIVATALTPPDAFSDLMLGAVMYGLYELTILAIRRSGH